MSEEIIGVIVGGVIGLIGSAVAAVLQHKEYRASRKHTEQLRLMEKRETVYEELAKALDEIVVAVIPAENEANAIRIDSSAYGKSLSQLEKALHTIQGGVTLYASSAVRKKIYELKSDIYELSTEAHSRSIPIKSIKESQAYSVMLKAQVLINLLRAELGITDN